MLKINGNYKKFNFPTGEKHVVVKKIFHNNINIIFDYENDAEIFELCLLTNALKNYDGVSSISLIMNYVPYGRQDRINIDGEPLSIKVFCDIINSLKFNSVYIVDPHSDVTMVLLDNCIVTKQHEFYFSTPLCDIKDHYLISPDGGALKKINKCIHKENTLDVIECSKKRSIETGEITKTIVHCDDLNNKTCIIVDDICDGGRTFIEIAKVLKEKNAGKIILYVTHGIFSKGLEVFNDLIDEIWTMKGVI